MGRTVLGGLAFLLLAGCQLPAERVPLKPLPEDGPPPPYAELIDRARKQASSANESFYINDWASLEEAAKGLKQTARFLGKATEVPVKHKDTLVVEAGDLGKEAGKLEQSAKAKEVKPANEALQRIHLMVRELRPEP